MIQLGREYEDTVTGFKGVATGHVNYITGCNQTLLAPRVAPDGAERESRWFDDQRMKELHAPAIVLDNGTKPGFDAPAPRR